MFCMNCGVAMTADNPACPACGKSNAPSGKPQNTSGPAIPPELTGPGGFSRFLNFEFMITPVFIKWIFILGAIGIIIGTGITVLAGLGLMVSGSFGTGVLTFFSAIIFGVLGLIWFRIVCEMINLFFAMHKELIEIKKKNV